MNRKDVVEILLRNPEEDVVRTSPKVRFGCSQSQRNATRNKAVSLQIDHLARANMLRRYMSVSKRHIRKSKLQGIKTSSTQLCFPRTRPGRLTEIADNSDHNGMNCGSI